MDGVCEDCFGVAFRRNSDNGHGRRAEPGRNGFNEQGECFVHGSVLPFSSRACATARSHGRWAHAWEVALPKYPRGVEWCCAGLWVYRSLHGATNIPDPMARVILLLALCLWWPSRGAAQISIYRTYANLLADLPVEMHGYTLRSVQSEKKNAQLVLTGEAGQPERTIDCATIWGFRLDSALFRIEPQFGHPALVVLTGEPCYYENGAAHLKMYLEGTHEEHVVWGAGGYLSHDLDSPMTFVPIDQYGYGRKETKAFLESRPAYAPILRCANKQFHTYMMRACITALRKGQLE